MSTRPLWFGHVLTWSGRGDRHVARHRGHVHTVRKLSQRQANDVDSGHAGWYLSAFPGELERGGPCQPFGPFLDVRREAALAKAEVWILAGDGASQSCPSLADALSDRGAECQWGRSASRLVVHSNPARAELEFHAHSRTGGLVGTVAVTFTPTSGDSVDVTWQPMLADGTILPECASWHEACDAVSSRS